MQGITSIGASRATGSNALVFHLNPIIFETLSIGDGALPTGTMSTKSKAIIANPLPNGGDSCSKPARVNAATPVAGMIRQLKSFHSGRPVAAGANMASLAAAMPAAAKMKPVDSAIRL